jgi:hypothetical protein
MPINLADHPPPALFNPTVEQKHDIPDLVYLINCWSSTLHNKFLQIDELFMYSLTASFQLVLWGFCFGNRGL